MQSHFYLDDLPQSTEPLDENPRPHSELGARIEEDFVSADEGYQARPFPQMRRPSFLGPGPDTDSESGPDEAFRRNGFDAPRPPPAAPSSSVSGRLGDAALRGGEAIIAAGATGVGQAVERFGFRNAERVAAQVEQRVLPRIIGRPADAEQLIIRAGQRAQEVERAAADDIEQFAAEQAAAETAEITPLLVETGAAAAETGGFAAVATGAAEALGRPGVRSCDPCSSGAGRGSRRSASCRSIRGGHADGSATGQRSCSCSGRRARGSQGRCFGLPHRAQHRASWRSGCRRLGRGSVGTGHGRDGARYMLGGNGGDAASSSGGEFQDLRTLNGMQQGTPQERFSVQQPRVQQDIAPEQQRRRRARGRKCDRAPPQPRMPFGLNPVAQASSGSESYAPIRRPRPQRPEPSFNELRREALAREPEGA